MDLVRVGSWSKLAAALEAFFGAKHVGEFDHPASVGMNAPRTQLLASLLQQN